MIVACINFETLEGKIEQLFAQCVVFLLVFELFDGALVGLVSFDGAGAVITEQYTFLQFSRFRVDFSGLFLAFE